MTHSDQGAKGAVSNFSFSARTGLSAGLKLAVGVPTVRNDGSIHPPHVRCGGSYIETDSHSVPLFERRDDGGCYVNNAVFRRVVPLKGNPFNLLSKGSKSPGHQLVFVDTAMLPDPRITDKFDPKVVRAWPGVIADDSVDVILSGGSSCLLKFDRDGQEARIFLPNGAVYSITRADGVVTSKLLGDVDTANARVAQFDEQLKAIGDADDKPKEVGEVEDNSSTKRRHGILGGAIRLLRLTGKRPAARQILTGFLRKHVDGALSKKMQEEIRKILLGWNDSEATFFIVGEDNLVDLTALRANENFRVVDRKGPPAKRKAQIAQRSARDSAERNTKKTGGSGGGNGGKQRRIAKG